MNRRVLFTTAAVLAAAIVPPLAVQAEVQDASIGVHKAHIYPAIDSAPADIDSAIAAARREHKNVILDFGGDWCPDCQVLNIYFHQSPNAELLAQSFVRVNINVGHLDANKNIAERYGVPLKGVPALAVLDGSGKVLYAQNKEFADMRHLDASALTAFLKEWKP